MIPPPDAWAPKRYPAQLRWQHSATTDSCSSKELSWVLQGGTLDQLQVNELNYCLGTMDMYLDPNHKGQEDESSGEFV